MLQLDGGWSQPRTPLLVTRYPVAKVGNGCVLPRNYLRLGQGLLRTEEFCKNTRLPSVDKRFAKSLTGVQHPAGLAKQVPVTYIERFAEQ